MYVFSFSRFFFRHCSYSCNIGHRAPGGKYGGILASIPTTIIPASVVRLTADGLEDFRDSLYIVPVGMLINALFLLLWRVVPPKLPQISLNGQLALMSVIGLSGWAVCAALCIGALQFWGDIFLCGGNPLALPPQLPWDCGPPTMRPQPQKAREKGVAVDAFISWGLGCAGCGLRCFSSPRWDPIGRDGFGLSRYFLDHHGLSVARSRALCSSGCGGTNDAWIFKRIWVCLALCLGCLILGPGLGALAAWVLAVLSRSGLALWWMRQK